MQITHSSMYIVTNMTENYGKWEKEHPDAYGKVDNPYCICCDDLKSKCSCKGGCVGWHKASGDPAYWYNN